MILDCFGEAGVVVDVHTVVDDFGNEMDPWENENFAQGIASWTAIVRFLSGGFEYPELIEEH